MNSGAAQGWFVAGTIPLIVFGALHAVLALRDAVRPRAFAPVDRSVRDAMQATGLRLRGASGGNAAPSMWSVWIGVHIGFGLFLCTVGLLFLLIAVHDFGLVEQIAPVRPLAIVFCVSSLAVSLRFFFYGPVMITAAATVCFSIATALSL